MRCMMCYSVVWCGCDVCVCVCVRVHLHTHIKKQHSWVYSNSWSQGSRVTVWEAAFLHLPVEGCTQEKRSLAIINRHLHLLDLEVVVINQPHCG